MSINLGTLAEDGTRIITKAQLLSGFPELGNPASIASFYIQSGAGSLANNGNGSWTYAPAPNDDSSVAFAVSATDGTTTLSTTAGLDLTPVNDAPVLTPISPHLTTITEDDANNPGQTVASIIGSSITDADGPDVAKGIAVIGAQSANGYWEYSVDDGASWTAFGSYSATSALLLDQTSKVRFVPDGSHGGSSTFTYVAWDETVTFGTTTGVTPGGGATPYSVQSDTAHISVLDVNDAPTLGNVTASASYTERAEPITLAPALTVADVDNDMLAAATVKIESGLTAGDVLSVDGDTSGLSGDIAWLYNAATGVLSFTGAGTKAEYQALLEQVQFSSTSLDPTAGGAHLTRTVAWQAGDGSALSGTSNTVVHVTGVNDAPVANPVDLGVSDEDTFRVITAAELLAGASDVDSAQLSIASLTIDTGNGDLQDNGDGTWTFTPAKNDDTAVTFAYSVTDGEHTAASTAALDLTPVNDAPTAVMLHSIAEIKENASTAQRIKIADIEVEDDGDGTNDLTVTGADAFAFEIIGNELFLKAGTVLDFEKKSSYAIEVQAGDPVLLTGATAKSLGSFLDITDVSPELVKGTARADKLMGGSDIDLVFGFNGPDILRGQASNDRLYGGNGKDKLFGDAGDDMLTGGAGKDFLRGGADRDTFDFNSIKDSVKGGQRDHILDFKPGEHDRIDLRTIDAQKGGGNQKFKWIGTEDFNGKKGELHYVQKGANALVEGDVNGDGKADFQILLLRVDSLSKGDFLL